MNDEDYRYFAVTDAQTPVRPPHITDPPVLQDLFQGQTPPSPPMMPNAPILNVAPQTPISKPAKDK